MKRATPVQLRAFAKDPFIAELLRQIPPRVIRGAVEPGVRVIGIEFADGAVFRVKPEPARERTYEDQLQAEATWFGKGPYPSALKSADFDKRTRTWRRVVAKKKKKKKG